MGAILIDRWPSDAGTMTANNTAGARWGASNVQKYTLDKAARSDSVSATYEHSADFGSAQNIDSFAMDGHNILETDTLLLQYADDAGMTTNVVAVPLTWSAGVIWATFTSISKGYRKLTVTKTSASDYVQIGRMVDAQHTELSAGLRTPGDQGGIGRTTGTSVTTDGGQKYGTIGAAMKRLVGSFPALDADDIAELEFIKETYQEAVPFFMIIRNGQTLEDAFYGTLDTVNTYRYVSPDSRDIPWAMTEQK